jgi:nitroreductase
MNEVLENIKNRRSVRSYRPDPIPRDILKKIIEAGNMAPTGVGRQPWRFVVVEDPEFKRKLSQVAFKFLKGGERPEIYKLLKYMQARYEEPIYHSAPVILFVIGTATASPTHLKESEAIDCALASQNIMLAACSLGIGSCMVGLGSMGLKDDPEIVEALELKEDETLYLPIVLGYPDSYPEPPRKKPPVLMWI